MKEILAQHWTKILIGGIAIAYYILKYLPSKSLKNGNSEPEFNYALTPEIISLVESYSNKDFKTVESGFEKLNASHRSFALNALSEVPNNSLFNEWLEQSPDNQLALIIKGAKLTVDAWEVRGSDTIDKVDPDDLVTFKSMLEESRKTLVNARQKSDKFSVSANSMLLRLYKALNIDRSEIHNTFKIANKISPNNINLNINYYGCLSEKWGGTKEEMEAYYNDISDNEILRNILETMGYIDQFYFEVYDYSKEAEKAWIQKVRSFIKAVDTTPLDESNLHKYELFRLLAVLAEEVELDSLATKYEQKSAVYYNW